MMSRSRSLQWGFFGSCLIWWKKSAAIKSAEEKDPPSQPIPISFITNRDSLLSCFAFAVSSFTNWSLSIASLPSSLCRLASCSSLAPTEESSKTFTNWKETMSKGHDALVRDPDKHDLG